MRYMRYVGVEARLGMEVHKRFGAGGIHLEIEVNSRPQNINPHISDVE